MSNAGSGEFAGGIHRIAYRVHYEDTDAAGVVYYANYLRFAERARSESLRLLGINQSELLHSQGIGFVVRHIDVDFLQPLRLDDMFVMETSLNEFRKVRMTMRQSCRRDGVEMVRMQVEIACVDRHFQPTRIPEALGQKILAAFDK